MARFKESGYNFPEPTIVFHMWMQDYRDSKDNFEFSTFRPSVHGVSSMVYKSLSRLVRAAVFDSLMELVVLQKPIGMNFDRPMCPLESRQKGTKTCPKEAHSSQRRRKDSLNTDSTNLTKSLSSKKSLFHSSSEKVDLETSYQKSRGFSLLKSKNSDKILEKPTTRNTEKVSVENGETGALHNYYKNQFRDWIRKESKCSVQNAPHANDLSHPTINFIDFSRGNQIRVPSWKIFERSCVSPIKNKFSELWAKSACSGDQENICRVFYRAESEGDFMPSTIWKNVKTVSGQKVECAMFLRDNDDWQRCTQRSDEPPTMSRSNSMNCLRPSSTRNYAKFGNYNGNSSNEDHELSRQSCAMLTLENSEECENPILCLYMYNVSENLGEQMIDFLKKLLTAQLVRYELLTAITKLKLGLSQPIQHSRQYENLPTGNLFTVTEQRKSKKCYDYQDVVDNNVENLQKPAPDKSVVINSFCAAFRNTYDIPVLENEGDPPTNHGRQFLAMMEPKKASKNDEQDSRLPQILHEWAEATKDGRLHEHEISHADLQLIKTYSTVKHFEEEPIWFHSERCHVINNPTRHKLRKRNTTPPGIEVSRMRPRAKVVAASDRRQRSGAGLSASRRMNNLGAQPPTQFDQQSGRRRRQKQAFFELIRKHVSTQFPPNSLRNIQFSDKDDSFSTISFQFCIDPIFAVVFEIMIDLKRKNTASLTVFALNMALVSSERDDFDYCEKLASLDSSIDQNVDKLVKTFNFPGILAEVHLSIVFQDWSEYYTFEIRKMCKQFPGTLRAKESLFPLNFDYTDYLSFLHEQNIKKKLVNGDFLQGSLIVPYTHNIPAKDFFKYLVKDSTLDHDCDTKPIQFVELRSERKIMDAEENRSYILLQREYDAGAYKTVAIIYHDDSCEPEKEELKELKLAYWIVAVRNPEKSSKMTFADAIALVKKEVTSKDAGLPKLFDNVGEKCYKDHLWKLQQTGSAALSDLKELLNNADVAVLEISHELDERLKVLNRLGNEWLKKLGTFISEECSKDRIQISAYEDKGKCRHLAVFNQSGDYKILILLTVSDNDEETRIRALLKDIPRGTKWEEVSRAGKHRNSWVCLRTEIENFMVAITLFLVKTMLDD
ncbi:unnamed protein product [Oikopleura dioica]|uniref:Uncharacterized protein n=1 Tax=Oikopleura dioica TaxID=34765 RepID=E4YLZ2_OIKDI|nr:unnamed protein product [Oikopleura dioica]